MIILDCHKGLELDQQTKEWELSAIRSGQKDEFGVKPLNVYYNDAEEKSFCLTEAPSIDAVRKSHEKMGVNCEEIVPVRCLADCRR